MSQGQEINPNYYGAPPQGNITSNNYQQNYHQPGYMPIANQPQGNPTPNYYQQNYQQPVYIPISNHPQEKYQQSAIPGYNYQSPQPATYIVKTPQQSGPYINNSNRNVNNTNSDGFEKPEDDGKWHGFSELKIRQAFIRKVYCILMIQLLVTLGIICVFIYVEDVRIFARANPSIIIISYVIFLVVYLILVCCESVRRSYPCNFIWLTIFTLSFSYLCGCLAMRYTADSVIMCVGICAICCFAITIFSFNTKYDITSCLGFIFIISIVVFIFGIITIFFGSKFPIMHTIYSSVAGLLFMVFLAIDTQMLMHNKKYTLSPEEYIFASLQLYIDIVYILIHLLALFGEER